jgi:hypothetical protein
MQDTIKQPTNQNNCGGIVQLQQKAIGKAMSALTEGTGLVLVLVSLQ